MMNKLTFYRHKRKDGGVRTGIEFNDDLLLHLFTPGEEPSDSALVWYVDVRCSGKALPSDAEDARKWFLAHTEAICRELRHMAENLIGLDQGAPVRREIPAEGDTKIEIYCSAVKRLSPEELSTVLSELAKQWTDLISTLAIVDA